MKFRKIEISLAVGLLCALVWCALEPGFLMSWWGAAFEPLCDGVLTAEGEGGEAVLRSFFAELLEKINAGLANVKENGTYDELLKKWGLA